MNPSENIDITVVGSNMVDLLSKIPRLPMMGESLIGTSFHLGFGGKGANQAVMAARLGAKVVLITKVGDDIFGPMTKENLRQQGIDVRYVLSEQSASSGVAPILVDESGRNLVVAVPGANSMLGSKDVREAEEAICQAKIVISQLEIPDEAIAEAFSIARSASVTTILNPAPARQVEANIIKMADWIVPNETEAESLTGIHIDSLDRAIQACQILDEMGAGKVIITLGDNGALLYINGSSQHFPAYPVKAVDTTGAGDAFIGGLAYSLMKENNIQNAIHFANRCAALSVTRVGTQVSFPSLKEIEEIL